MAQTPNIPYGFALQESGRHFHTRYSCPQKPPAMIPRYAESR